jgi:tRNA(Leu) C34 or U34 (ribose-2'-O)-methylase TrmL
MIAGAPGARRAGREASQVLNIVLYAPEIPANTGNIGRTCVLTGSRLHLVEPLGFSLDSRMLRRAGLGYWQNLDVTRYAGWDEFLRQNGWRPRAAPHPARVTAPRPRARPGCTC